MSIADALRILAEKVPPNCKGETKCANSALTDASQPGADIASANDEGATVHVPEYTATNGKRYSFDLTVPQRNLDGLRAVIRFTLRENQGGGSLLGEPGDAADELRELLEQKYGLRLESIDGQKHQVGEFNLCLRPKIEVSYRPANPEISRTGHAWLMGQYECLVRGFAT